MMSCSSRYAEESAAPGGRCCSADRRRFGGREFGSTTPRDRPRDRCLLGNLAFEVDERIEMLEGIGGSRVGRIVGGDVDGLHRRDGPAARRGDAFLQFAHLGCQRRLITDGRRHTAQERGHFGARLGKAEDVIDEEEHVLAGLITKPFAHGESGERNAQTSAGVRSFGRRPSPSWREPAASRRPRPVSRFLHFEPKVVAFAVRSPTPANTERRRRHSWRYGRSIPAG